jgi:DNA helicase-2/ATP-dependent DNA helicase PcrA
MIYGFRGADGKFILNFKKIYQNAEIIRLEQNYRSTKNIVQAANNLISYNQGRLGKKLWTQEQEGY